MTVVYDYNEDEAGLGVSRIDTSGVYVGKFTSVEPLVSENTGTQGIRFAFASKDGLAEFSLWTLKADGTKLPSYFQLMDIQLLFAVKGLRSSPGKVQKYNKETQKREEVDGEVFEMLMNRPIGVALQREDYDGNNGDAFRMNLYEVFDPETKKTAKEKKEGKPAARIASIKIKDKDQRKNRAAEAAVSLTVPAGI